MGPLTGRSSGSSPLRLMFAASTSLVPAAPSIKGSRGSSQRPLPLMCQGVLRPWPASSAPFFLPLARKIPLRLDLKALLSMTSSPQENGLPCPHGSGLSAVTSMYWRLRLMKKLACQGDLRYNHILDSNVARGALVKGRSSSKALAQRCCCSSRGRTVPGLSLWPDAPQYC